MNTKKLTLLHSNDLHGDFFAEENDKKLVGGVSMLSGYLNKVRNEEENVIYAIAGDMFRGSVIDSEFKGVSTIEIMNLLAPDVVSLGNHEIDYGIAHLLFLERCTKFPIVNANLYIRTNRTRLFNSHTILKCGGMNILFIGIVTEEVSAGLKSDNLLGTFVDIQEAANEVGKICNNYHSVDIDFTVLLTHIGFEEDKKLAALLEKSWGVDVIIGGHSHTVPEKPEKVNDILIVQAGKGTDMIGRFDITVDTDDNCISDYKWQLIPIDSSHCPRDEELEKVIEGYKSETDKKYARIITHLTKQLTHPKRNRETEIGNLFADIFKESLGVDIMLLGSGSIRNNTLGPIVDYGALSEMFPFDDEVMLVTISGEQFRKMIMHILRDDAYTDETEFYQVPKNVHVEYSYPDKKLEKLEVNGKEVSPKDKYTLALQQFHFNSMEDFLGVSLEEVEKNAPAKPIASSCFQILEEYLSVHNHLSGKVEGRLTIKGRPD